MHTIGDNNMAGNKYSAGDKYNTTDQSEDNVKSLSGSMHKPNTAPGKVPINRIIPVSTVDGPGARTAVFIQGCNLACEFCHNPETQAMIREKKPLDVNKPENTVDGTNIPDGMDTADGRNIPDGMDIVDDTDTPVNKKQGSKSFDLRLMSAKEVFEDIRPNIPFIRGITTSGGECALYPEFLEELFSLAKSEGLSTLMDTNGSIDLSKFPDLMAVTDGVMLDLKAWDPQVFERLTGKKPTGALTVNLQYLASKGKLAEIRLVCQEHWVDIKDALKGVANTIPGKYRTTPLKLIAFRRHGVTGKMQNAKTPTAPQMEDYRKIGEELGFENILLR